MSNSIRSTASFTQLFHEYNQAHPAAVGKNIMPFFKYAVPSMPGGMVADAHVPTNIAVVEYFLPAAEIP